MARDRIEAATRFSIKLSAVTWPPRRKVYVLGSGRLTGKRSGHRASAGIAHSQDLNRIAFVSQEAGSLHSVASDGAP